MARKQKSASEPSKPTRPGSGGKVENDANKTGSQPPMQKNEGQRTPQSRNDRETQLGADNQSQARKGGSGTPSGGKAR
jgi:hypothetical protein